MARRRREFSFRTPGVFGKLLPKDAMKELKKLKKKYGRITPEIVLESAYNPKSPLHDMFEWDDKVAAEKYRLRQAQLLILNIREERKYDGATVLDRVFVRTVDDQGSHYIEIDEAKPADIQMIMGNAVRDLKAWASRYEELSDRLPGLFDEIKDIIGEE